MGKVRSNTWSKVLLTLGAIGLFMTGILGWLNAAVVNGENFAGLVNEIRQDEAVKTEIGQAVAVAALDAQPDLIAVEPAIAAGAAAVAGSPLLDGVFTPAIRSFHDAMTEKGSDSAVLKLADLGATATTALEKFVPQAADIVPANLNLTLAEVGGQEGIAGQIIPVIQAVSTLAWVVPLISLLLVALGIWLAPKRRLAIVRFGWMLLVVAGFLGLVVLGLNVAGLFLDDSTLQGAVISAALAVFSQPLSIRFIAIGVVGGLLVASAGALLPQVDVGDQARTAVGYATRRPAATGWAVARALLVIAVGLLIVLFPTISSQVVAVVAGLAVLFYGVTELDVIAERSRAQDEAEEAAALAATGHSSEKRRSPVRWLIPVAAAAVGLLVLAALIIPGNLPQDDTIQTASAVNTTACNGFDALCDVPFDQVVIPASHNSMSIADGTWFLAEQPKDMVKSLDDGIRGLLVDTWYGQPTEDGGAITAPESLAGAEAELTATYGKDVVASIQRTIDRVRRSKPSGPTEPYFCHTVCEIGPEPMAPVMDRLNTWMDEHPVRSSCCSSRTPSRRRTPRRSWRRPAWPTRPTCTRRRRMADPAPDDRLEQAPAGADGEQGRRHDPYLHQGFDLVQDTEYTFKSAADFDCSLKRGEPDSPLFSVNHWLASFSALISSAEEVNVYNVLSRASTSARSTGQSPR